MNHMSGWICICGGWHSTTRPDDWCDYYKQHYASRLSLPVLPPPKPKIKVAPEEFEI